jgi:uncharacterized protein YjbJ (UPF0337 family)
MADKIENVVDQAKAAAGQVAGAAKTAAGELRDRARSAAESVREDAVERAETARSGIADEVASLGRAMQRGQDELRSGSPQARMWGEFAGTLDSAAQALREQDLGSLADGVRRFARDNPATFLGGAMLLGLAASRFVRAGTQSETHHDRDMM